MKVLSKLLVPNCMMQRLWKGSTLQLAHRDGWLTVKMMEDKIASLSRCDDTTPDEKTLLAALKQDLELNR